jgi:predicted DNA-binding transcriptional regulator AlpA
MKQAALAVDERLLRKKEVGWLLACSARHIDRLASSGQLERVKVLGAVRFRWSQVQAIMGGGAS